MVTVTSNCMKKSECMEWIYYSEFALLWNNICSIYNATVFLQITPISYLDLVSASEIAGIYMEGFLSLLREQLPNVDVKMLKYILWGTFTGKFHRTFDLLTFELTEC